MDKISRFFRSRYVSAAFCILLEFVLLVAAFVFLYRYKLPITILGWVFHFVMLLYLINRDEIPELNITWLVILFLMPVVGAFVFVLLTSNRPNRKQYRLFKKAANELTPYLQQTKRIEALQNEDEDAYVQANYLYNIAKMPCYEYTSTTYYPIGEDFNAALIEDLNKAEKFIFMEYFIVHEGKMWDPIHEILKEKAAQGIPVYFMYDDFGCIATLPERYYEQLCSEGIHCIPGNKFTPILSHIHNNRDHRKITVIDGKVGFTGGINLADEYINDFEKYGHWKDSAVRIEGQAVKNLSALFIANWNMQSKDYIDCDLYMQAEPIKPADKGAVIPFGDSPSPIDTDDIGKNVYLNIINSAKRYLYITTPYLICDHELLSSLRMAAQKGVDVRIITPHIPDKKLVFLMTRSNYKVLIDSGVKIYEYTPGFIHAKNFISDDKFAVCGTINLDYRSLVHHFECGAWMYNTECVGDMKKDFLVTVAKSEEITSKNAELSRIESFLASILKVFSPLL